MDNEQCKDCIHRDVCAYKEHYEDVLEHYKKAREEAGKYPWFTLSIYCVKYNAEKPYTLRNVELPAHTNSLELTQEMPKRYQPIKVVSLERVKQVREQIEELSTEQIPINDEEHPYIRGVVEYVSLTEVRELLDNLISESEEK